MATSLTEMMRQFATIACRTSQLHTVVIFLEGDCYAPCGPSKQESTGRLTCRFGLWPLRRGHCGDFTKEEWRFQSQQRRRNFRYKRELCSNNFKNQNLIFMLPAFRNLKLDGYPWIVGFVQKGISMANGPSAFFACSNIICNWIALACGNLDYTHLALAC